MFTGKAPFSTERSHYWQYEYHSEMQSDTWEYPLNLLTVPKENPLISKNKNICYVSQYILTLRCIWVQEPVWKRPRYNLMLTGLLLLIGHQITVLESLWMNDGLISLKKDRDVQRKVRPFSHLILNMKHILDYKTCWSQLKNLGTAVSNIYSCSKP